MWKLKLQMFAEDEQTPTEEVEASSVDATEEDDVDLGDDETEESQEQQTKKHNNEYAQKRIKAKKEAEQRQQEEKRKEFLRGIQAGNEGKNRFTGRLIKDEEDLVEFETMLEMEEKGLDPVEDYSEYVKDKRRAERQAQLEKTQQEQQADERSQKDIDEFVQKYSKDTATKLFQNKDFVKFSEGLLGLVPLTVIYEKFTETQTITETNAEKLVMQKDARRQASSGSLTQTPQPQRKRFSEMSREEFKAFQDNLL